MDWKEYHVTANKEEDKQPISLGSCGAKNMLNRKEVHNSETLNIQIDRHDQNHI